MSMEVLETVSLALVLGVFSYVLSRRLNIPAILFYLLSGLACGPLGLGWLRVPALGTGLLVLVEIAVAVILFEGGLSLSAHRFRAESAAIGRILLLTIPMTGLGAALLARGVLGLSWKIALVFGALIVVTGPTVIGTLLKSVRLTRRLETMLHWESIWGDVIGVMLSAMALEFVMLKGIGSVGDIGLLLVMRLVGGIPLGMACGYLLGRILLPWTARLHDPIAPGLVAAAGALGTFTLAGFLVDASGPPAVAVAGFFLANLRGETLHEVRHFKEQLSSLFIGTLFVLLSAAINPLPLAGQWSRILFVAFFLGAVVRPAAVFIALLGTRVSIPERIYCAYIAPRGILAVAAAFYASLLVRGQQMEMAMMLDTTFAIVFLSGLNATLLCHPLAKLLRVTIPRLSTGILIVGVNRLSLEIARFATLCSVPVSFVDTQTDYCETASSRGYDTVCADVLTPSVYEEGRDVGFERLLAITTSDALNELVVREAGRSLGYQNVYRAVAGPAGDDLAVERYFHGNTAFAETFYVRWAVRELEQGRARFEVLVPEQAASSKAVALLEMDSAGTGLRIVAAGERVRGRALYFVASSEAPGTQ